MNFSEEWAEVRVGDLGQVFTGRTPSTKCPEYFGNEFFFITPGDMHQGKHVHATERKISDAGANLLRRIQLPPNSVCVSCIGWQMGEVVMTSAKSFTNQQINSIVPNNDVDPDFLYYSFVPRKQELLSLASAIGVRTPILNKSSFCDLHILLPPLETQRKISSILSAYDELIENNTRRIKILEEMAHALYREWFVHFRFPGHEKVRMMDSSLGRIPEKWEIKPLGEVTLNFDSRRKPLSSMQRAQRQGEYPYYGAAKILDYIDDFIFDGKYLLIAEDGSVITPNGKPVLQLVNAKFWVNNHTHIIQGKIPISTEFLYYRLLDLEISGYITGAAQPKVTQANLNRIPVIVPTGHLLLQFNEMAENCALEVRNLQRKNDNLRRTRDLLLPRMISGELKYTSEI
ncbi:MAG TPA: restriction endonuclease subunit S [Methanothrix sp.]|nr:restriction endonuclease subunit S [Methanothrix sp.]